MITENDNIFRRKPSIQAKPKLPHCNCTFTKMTKINLEYIIAIIVCLDSRLFGIIFWKTTVALFWCDLCEIKRWLKNVLMMQENKFWQIIHYPNKPYIIMHQIQKSRMANIQSLKVGTTLNFLMGSLKTFKIKNQPIDIFYIHF